MSLPDCAGARQSRKLMHDDGGSLGRDDAATRTAEVRRCPRVTPCVFTTSRRRTSPLLVGTVGAAPSSGRGYCAAAKTITSITENWTGRCGLRLQGGAMWDSFRLVFSARPGEDGGSSQD